MVRPCLVGLALLLGAPPPPSPAQRARPGFDVPPLLAPGQRVRVWTLEPAPTVPIPIMRQARITGTLLIYHPPDSLRVRRTGLLGVLSWTREPTLYWSTVMRIDEARGRDVLGGAAGGLAGAFGLALVGALAERAFGCDVPEPDSCTNVFKTTARLAVFTVPVGAVVGFFSTRWKRVY